VAKKHQHRVFFLFYFFFEHLAPGDVPKRIANIFRSPPELTYCERLLKKAGLIDCLVPFWDGENLLSERPSSLPPKNMRCMRTSMVAIGKCGIDPPGGKL